jgi:hypothetical protein
MGGRVSIYLYVNDTNGRVDRFVLTKVGEIGDPLLDNKTV